MAMRSWRGGLALGLCVAALVSGCYSGLDERPGERRLGGEVVEERALRHPGLGAKLIDRGTGKAV